MELDGISLHVVEAGHPSASPIIFLHGWPQSWVEWHPLMVLTARGTKQTPRCSTPRRGQSRRPWELRALGYERPA
ncbi:MAG: epoxide hydrolase N-terminal domain-containing protein [Solirubrobacteraceae bacterium]|jgi:pimeloyl-ACP methyl ester carboxylesterase